MDKAQEQMEVSQGDNIMLMDAQTNQINVLAHDVDSLQIASGAVNNNSGSSNLEENVVQGVEVKGGENVVQIEEDIRDVKVIQAEEESAVIELQNERMDEYEIPGCVKCMRDECGDPWCKWCTAGFCHKGQLCKNIYSHFAMCGRETNFCKDYRLRGSQNGRRFQN